MVFGKEGNKAQRIALWKQRVQIFSAKSGKTKEKLVPYILDALGDEGLEMFNAMSFSDEDKKDQGKILEKFKERLNITQPNFRAARLELHYYAQQPTETIDEFHVRCTTKMDKCNLNDDEWFELLLTSTPSSDLKKWLIECDEKVTMKQILEKGRSCQSTDKTIEQLKDYGKTGTASAVNNMDAIRKKKSRCIRCLGDHKLGRRF